MGKIIKFLERNRNYNTAIVSAIIGIALIIVFIKDDIYQLLLMIFGMVIFYGVKN